MTSREKFEAFVMLHKTPDQHDMLLLKSPEDRYYHSAVEAAWYAWQHAYAAGQEAMRERAASAYVLEMRHGTQMAADFIAGVTAKTAAIRALEIEK